MDFLYVPNNKLYCYNKIWNTIFMINYYIFHLGRGKTGSTSLWEAVNRLGIPCSHHYNGIDKKIYDIWFNDLVKDIKPNFDIVNYKCFTDHIIFRWFFVRLTSMFPEARFILTIRDENTWIESLSNHRLLQTGKDVENKEDIILRYKKYNNDVINYFKNTNQLNKLLIMDITKGDGYDKLCSFLNLPILNESFPHKKNKKTWKPKMI